MSARRRVAITGVGLVTPAGLDAPSTWARVQSARSCAGPITIFDASGFSTRIAAEVNGSELLFCAHHGRKYEEKLREVATSWHDETARLAEAR